VKQNGFHSNSIHDEDTAHFLGEWMICPCVFQNILYFVLDFVKNNNKNKKNSKCRLFSIETIWG